jgi:hypothetical protein
VSTLPDPADERLALLALERLTDDELERLHLQLFFEDEVAPGEMSKSVAGRALAMLANRLVRARCDATAPAAEARNTRALIGLRQRVAARYAANARGDTRDLTFVVDAYRSIVGRGIHPRELSHWLTRMQTGPLDREVIDRTLRQVADSERRALEQPRDAGACWLMGTSRTIGHDDWRRRSRDLDIASERPEPQSGEVRVDLRCQLSIHGSERCLVTAIASLYKGGAFIESFMENVCTQTIFADHCELIIVDAASPDGEVETVRRWMSRFPNVRYLRTRERVGIYEAWNIGVREARGEFVTNVNLDDQRRRDSFEIQAATLQALPEVDVVYQNVHYAMEPGLRFERVAALGFTSRVPRVTPAVMLAFNPPHNAPMWRWRLHDELGVFDTRYRSAGDYDFWLRCVVAGKVFHRVADPHVAYYQNPQGISTSGDSPGHRETREITAAYAQRLLCGSPAR